MSDLGATSVFGRRREGASTVRDQLKRATADLHRRLETSLDLLGPGLSQDRYRQILECFFGFYAPAEAGVERGAGPALGLPLRARADLIARDLLWLGLSRGEIADLPRCSELPRLSCPEELAGCLYVLEGACLGGRVIAPKLRERLGVTARSGASFFTGDGEGTGVRWRAFLDWLEVLARTSVPRAQIVASARATFLTFALWVEK